MKKHCQWILLAIVALGLPVRGATPESGADRLRKLLKLPLVTLEAGVSLNSEEGFSILQSKSDVPHEMTEVRKQLKGDSSDAERYGRLGDLYQKSGDPKRAVDSYAKSVSLFRKQISARADDPQRLASFGKALWSAGQDNEAESVLRRAVQLDEQCATCWQSLGHFLEAEAKRALLNPSTARANLSPEKLLAEVTSNKPAAEQVGRARKFASEASDCFDRALAITNSADAYLQRALHKSFDGYLRNVLAFVQGEKSDAAEIAKGMFNPDCLPDFQQASRLTTTDYRSVAMAAFFEAFVATLESEKHSHTALPLWDQLPDRSQRSVREAVARLENFGQNPDSHLAAGALECLAVVQAFVIGDRSGAEKNARRALVLDPTRENAWDMLIGFLAKPESYQELRTLCEQRLRQKETTRNRILLAKAYERLNQLDRAEQNIQAALRLDGDDFMANLSEAVLLMKRQRDGSGLGAAYRYLTHSEQVLRKQSGGPDGRYVQLTLISSIYYALRGDTDKARQLLHDVLEADKNNQDAREILSALSWSPSDPSAFR